MNKTLVFAGLIIYSANYVVGWLLHFRKIKMSKRTHRIFYAAILIILATELYLLKFLSDSFLICSFSTLSLLLLPLGKKGGIFHIIFSSTGYLLYFLFLVTL